MFYLPGDTLTQIHSLRKLFDLELVAHTRDGSWSLLLSAVETSDWGGLPTQVIDTAGTDDSFNSTLCNSLTVSDY